MQVYAQSRPIMTSRSIILNVLTTFTYKASHESRRHRWRNTKEF